MAFRKFASKSLLGDFKAPLLKGQDFAGTLPADFLLGRKSKKFPARRFKLGRLSTAYLEVTRQGSRCRPGRLTMQVSGASTPKAFIALARTGKRTRSVRIAGGRSKISVALKSCRKARLALALINAGTAGNVTFKVTGSFTVRS